MRAHAARGTRLALHPRTRMDLAGITVLVVDDHADTLELAGLVLEWDGATVLSASNAEEGLRLLDRHPVDVVVCDLHLPRVDGVGFARAVRGRTDAKRHVPILGVSGDVTPESIATMIAGGFDRFLAKPLDTDVLLDFVRQLVGRTPPPT